MIKVYGLKEKLDPIKSKLSDVIHSCMQSTLDLPADKRAHRFIPMDKSDYYYPSDRSEAYTVIEINMMQGRSKETLKLLIKSLFKEIENKLAIAPIDIEITIMEQATHCWGFRGVTGDEAKLSYKIDI
jgi:hypothetical protein